MGKSLELKCSACRKGFACKRYLVKHMARMHSKEKEVKKPLECGICGKEFPRLSHLQRHQLTHIKEREWGCPFCEKSFVQKPHLTRHIGRRHAFEDSNGLEERINANKWRADGTPVQPSASGSVVKPPSTPQLCSGLVPSLLCIKCGFTFSTRTDLDRHITNTHRPMKCNHCGRIFDGHAKFKAHEMQERDQTHACSCGASFFRAAELRAHKDSCRKRGSFLCIVCDEVFTQRVQLDRHWNKKHFLNPRCRECEWRASAPLRLAEHAIEEHVKNICGYCGIENPEEDHVATEHWRRLSKSVALKKSDCKKAAMSTPTPSQDDVLSCEEEMSSDEELTVDELSKEDDSEQAQVTAVSTCEGPCTPSTSSSDSEATTAAAEIQDADCDKSVPVLSETSDQAKVSAESREECYLNVVVSVPDDVVNEFHFGSRLPPEILRLFPEFANARLCLVEPFAGESRFLSLHIPVAKPKEGDAEVVRLLSVPIYV